MNARNRIWILITAVAAIGVIALGWFVGISPRLEEARVADEARAQVEATSATYEAQLAQLKADYENIDELRAQLDAIELKLPQTPDYAAYLTTVTNLIDGTGVGLSNFSWGSPTLVSADAAGATGAPSSDSGLAPNGTLVFLPVTLSIDGQLSSIQSYLARLQAADRYLLISNVALNVSSDSDALGGHFNATVAAGIFLVVGPDTQPQPVDPAVVEPGTATAP